MATEWERLLGRQKGLVTAKQAAAFGIAPATLHRRIRGHRPQWQKVLPRVYGTFVHPLTERQTSLAAWLYAGEGAVLTGAAALHWRLVGHLPREVAATPVDVIVPAHRDCASLAFVRIHRTRRAVEAPEWDHVPCASVARAVADCTRRLTSYETALSVVSCALNARQATHLDLAAELALGPTRGSRALRAILQAADVRSVPEGRLLELVLGSVLPAPFVNEPLVVNGRRLVPDLRWGRLIVEVDSRLHHLLTPGAWEATQERRLWLEQAGYHVLAVTPEQIRDHPDEVLAAIITAYRAQAGA